MTTLLFLCAANFFFNTQHTYTKLSGNGLLSSKALRNRSQIYGGRTGSNLNPYLKSKRENEVPISALRTITGYVYVFVDQRIDP